MGRQRGPVEVFVREEPTQYWWLHRRWKHRPRGEQQEILTLAPPSSA
ncbi:MAG: LpxL/LpxP family acyltransferase [Planctomycetota bacterium]